MGMNGEIRERKEMEEVESNRRGWEGKLREGKEMERQGIGKDGKGREGIGNGRERMGIRERYGNGAGI